MVNGISAGARMWYTSKSMGIYSALYYAAVDSGWHGIALGRLASASIIIKVFLLRPLYAGCSILDQLIGTIMYLESSVSVCVRIFKHRLNIIEFFCLCYTTFKGYDSEPASNECTRHVEHRASCIYV